MLDEIKIKLMTRAAIFEKNEKNRDWKMSRYYREDYVKYGCLRTLVTTTFVYWITVAAVVMLRFSDILGDLNNKDFFKIVIGLMAGWVAAMAVFFIYAFFVYSVRYQKAEKKLKVYRRDLKKLDKLYEIREQEQYTGVRGQRRAD